MKASDAKMIVVPLSSTSRSRALTFCSSMLGASGSKRPSFWAFFQASTLSDRVSYSSAGITYFSTEETSEKSVRAAAGRVSSTCQSAKRVSATETDYREMMGWPGCKGDWRAMAVIWAITSMHFTRYRSPRSCEAPRHESIHTGGTSA